MAVVAQFKAKQIVGVSDAKVAEDKDLTLVTYGLRTGVGVVLVDNVSGICGMLHFQMPSYHDDKACKVKNPLMYGDTGMDWLMTKMQLLGANVSKLKVYVVGGATDLSCGSHKNIGRQNYTSIRRYLWVHDLFITAEDCGGECPRNIFCDVDTFSITVKSNQDTFQL